MFFYGKKSFVCVCVKLGGLLFTQACSLANAAPGLTNRGSVGPAKSRHIYRGKKVYFTSLNYPQSLVFLPELQNRVNHLPQLLKLSILPPWTGYRWFSKTVLFFCFLFISVEYLKNHSKSQKNHKIENLILLDSTWVDLYSEHIIWYVLIQSFCCGFRSMLLCN